MSRFKKECLNAMYVPFTNYIHMSDQDLHYVLKIAVKTLYSRLYFLFNPFPHTINLQQATLKTYTKEIGNFLLMKIQWLNRVRNMLTQEEIARFKQFLLLSTCFKKAVCCRGIKKRLYEGKGKFTIVFLLETNVHRTWVRWWSECTYKTIIGQLTWSGPLCKY